MTETTDPSCVCGEPATPGTAHRTDGPCYVDDQPAPADRTAVLTADERAMLSFALDLAQDRIFYSEGEFTDEDQAAVDSLRRMADEAQQPEVEVDATILAELQQHLAEHTPSCNARTDHLMRRAAWALGAPRPTHVGGNAEDCPACTGTNPDYPFICPGPNPTA
jgi:hypothetical protein